MTLEEFQKKVKKWGWICSYIPHKYVSADNEVVSGCAICLRCGNITSAEEAGLSFDPHAMDGVIGYDA